MDKELLAAQVMDRYAEFTTALTSSKRKYPMQEFEATQDDQLIDRNVARVITGLADEITLVMFTAWLMEFHPMLEFLHF